MKTWIKSLSVSVGLLTACQTTTGMVPQTNTVPGTIQAQSQKPTPLLADRYLCTVEHRTENGVVKIMDLTNRTVRSVFIPGHVTRMSGLQATQKLYASAYQGENKGNQSLYEVDIVKGTVSRTLAFSQIGLNPEDVMIDQGKLYTTGFQQTRGALFSYDLNTKGWQPLAYDIKPGVMQWGTSANVLQVLHFNNAQVTRTTVEVSSRRVSSYSYAFTHLNEQDNKFYGGTITRFGDMLYASVNNRIERYEIKGTQFTRLNPIELKYADVRFIALSRNDRTLYVSHEKQNRVSLVRMNPDGLTYTLDEIAFPGENNELVVF